MLIKLAIIWAFIGTILKLASVSFMSQISWYLILLPLPIIAVSNLLLVVILAFALGAFGGTISLRKRK
jgi:uncharacterized protein YacL